MKVVFLDGDSKPALMSGFCAKGRKADDPCPWIAGLVPLGGAGYRYWKLGEIVGELLSCGTAAVVLEYSCGFEM